MENKEMENKDVKYSKYVESVILDLDDKGLFELKFDHIALEMAEKILNRPLTKLIGDNLSTNEIRVLFKCAISHKENLNYDQIKEILRPFSVMYVAGEITKAFEIGLGKDETEEDESEEKK